MVSRLCPLPRMEGTVEAIESQLKVETNVLFVHRIVLLADPPMRCSSSAQSSPSLVEPVTPKAKWEYE